MCDVMALKEVLSVQCDIHQKLLSLEETKTKVLLDGDPEALMPLMNEQQALLMQGREIEKRRMAICEESPHATLKELIQSSDDCKAVLEPLFIKLSEIVFTLKKKSSLNNKLLETRLSTIRFLTGEAGLNAGANTYTKSISTKG